MTHTIIQNFISKQQLSTRMKKIFTSMTLCMAFFTTSLLAQAPVFTDDYAMGVTFAAFGDSKNTISIDNTVNQSGTSSLKIVMPATGYTGGALVAATPQNLSTYNAVSFWIKGSAAKKLDKAGLGNNAATTVYQTELIFELFCHSMFQKFSIEHW